MLVLLAIAVGVGVVAGTNGGLSLGTGVITGILASVGGPEPRPPSPVPGSVVITNVSTGAVSTTPAGRDGRFSVEVPVGTYRLTATSPMMGGGRMHGITNGPVRVGWGARATENVYFEIR